MKYYLKPFLILSPVIILIAYYLVALSNRSEFAEVVVEPHNQIKTFERLNVEEFKTWKGLKYEGSGAVEPIIIMHFWASWCAPCIHEFPDLINMAKALKGQVKVFAISEDKEIEEIQAFIKSFKDAETTDNFHIIWDQEHKIMNEWEVNKLPESFIYGPDRKLAKRISGVVSWTSQDTKEYFDKLRKPNQSASK